MAGIKALRKIQLGKEVTAGTLVLTTTKWRGTGGLKDSRSVVFPEEAVGLLSKTDRSYVERYGGLVTLDDTPATFEQLLHLLDMGVKTVAAVADGGGGSGKIYTYTFPTTAANSIKTRTVEMGDNQQMEKAGYGFAKSIKLGGKGGEALMMGAELESREVKVVNYSAATIAFVTATHKITDSANGLAGFTTGMTITISGSTSNDGTYTVATGGVAAEIVVTEALVDEAAAATVTVAQSFTAAATLPTVEEILFSKGKLYIDAIGGTIGTTLKSNTLLGASLEINTGFNSVFAADGSLDFSFIKNVGPELKLNITFEHDGTATAEKAFFRSQTARLIRLKFEGVALTTAGTAYTYKTLIIDLAGKWESFEALGDQDGNDIVTGVFRAAYNSTAAKFAEIVVVNELASLP